MRIRAAAASAKRLQRVAPHPACLPVRRSEPDTPLFAFFRDRPGGRPAAGSLPDWSGWRGGEGRGAWGEGGLGRNLVSESASPEVASLSTGRGPQQLQCCNSAKAQEQEHSSIKLASSSKHKTVDSILTRHKSASGKPQARTYVRSFVATERPHTRTADSRHASCACPDARHPTSCVLVLILLPSLFSLLPPPPRWRPGGIP